MKKMLKDAYDVVVAGGGPGGLSAAKHLALLGHDVLVLEKRQEIGSPKRCAEGLSVATAEMIGEIPSRFRARKIDGAMVYSPDGNAALIDFGGKSTGYVLERKVFDKWLAFEASRAGATILAHSPVTGVIKEGERVVGVKAVIDGEGEAEIRAGVVVAADGVESRVARLAGLDTTNKLINEDSGFQYEMSNVSMPDNRKIHLYFGNDIAPRGYVWIFPKGEDVANVGIGIALSEKPAKSYLDRFIEENPEMFGKASVIEVNSGGIPVGGFLEDMVLDGFLVVGDAAHQVNPIHGGGLKEATVAGKIAADVIHGALEKGDVSREALSPYNKAWWKERGAKLKNVEKLRQVVEKLSDGDLNMLSRALTGDVLMELSRGNKLRVLAKALMKKPGLIKLARHLV